MMQETVVNEGLQLMVKRAQWHIEEQGLKPTGAVLFVTTQDVDWTKALAQTIPGFSVAVDFPGEKP